ncbi:MAG: hypothetical protein WKF37_11345 [Bryobacteraceae bacterium]
MNGELGKASYLVKSADKIDVEPAALPALHAFAEDIPLDCFTQTTI